MNPPHILPVGLSAFPKNSNGVPFNANHVYAIGNLAADMYANVAAEATGRVLACGFHAMTDDPSIEEMRSFLITRDIMHQQQCLPLIEDLVGVETQLPTPNSFSQEKEDSRFSYAYFVHDRTQVVPEGRWTQGPSIDGKGKFSAMMSEPLGEIPTLAPARPNGFAQRGQMSAALARSAQMSAALETGLPSSPAGVL